MDSCRRTICAKTVENGPEKLLCNGTATRTMVNSSMFSFSQIVIKSLVDFIFLKLKNTVASLVCFLLFGLD